MSSTGGYIGINRYYEFIVLYFNCWCYPKVIICYKWNIKHGFTTMKSTVYSKENSCVIGKCDKNEIKRKIGFRSYRFQKHCKPRERLREGFQRQRMNVHVSGNWLNCVKGCWIVNETRNNMCGLLKKRQTQPMCWQFVCINCVRNVETLFKLINATLNSVWWK